MDLSLKSKSKSTTQKAQYLNYYQSKLAQIQQLIQNQEKKCAQIESNMKSLEDTIDTSLYQQTEMTKSYVQASNKDLQRKVHILEKVPVYMNISGTHCQESHSQFSKYNGQSSGQACDQNSSKGRHMKANQRLLKDFHLSSQEQEEVKQSEVAVQNDELHNQIISQSNNLIENLKNLMNEKGQEFQVNQLLSQIESQGSTFSQAPETFSREINYFHSDQVSSIGVSLTDKKEQAFIVNNNSCQNTHIHSSNEDSQTFDSTYQQDEIYPTKQQPQSTFSSYMMDPQEFVRQPDQMIFEQDFNWRLDELQNPMSCGFMEEVQDLDKLVSKSNYSSALHSYHADQMMSHNQQPYYPNMTDVMSYQDVYMAQREQEISYNYMSFDEPMDVFDYQYSPLNSISLQ